MKNLFYIKLIFSIIFACLFYMQGPGLNILAFAMLLIAGLFCLKKAGSQHPVYIYCLFLAGACSVFIYGNTLSLVTCFLMTVLLAGKVVFTRQAMAFALIPGFVNGLSALPVRLHKTLADGMDGRPDATGGENKLFKMFRLVLVFIVVSIFFILYMNSSAGFANLVKSGNIEFPRFNFWLMLLSGAFICNAVFHHPSRSLFKYMVPKKPEDINAAPAMDENSAKSWLSTGTALFVALNILSGIVLITDISFVVSGTVGKHNPAFYSQIVHEGVGALIFSVVLAIALLFIFFEGRINFQKGNAVARNCAYVWIILNLLLVILTMYKNSLYISELGMTYKRIGVWYYLGASIIGLYFMYIKIKKYKNFLYMIRRPVAAYVFILLVSSFIPWEIGVTKFNIAQAERKGIRPDIDYLLNLDGNNLHLLKAYIDGHTEDSTYNEHNNMVTARINQYRHYEKSKDLRSLLLAEQYSLNELEKK